MKAIILACALALSMALPALAKDDSKCQKPSGRGAKGCIAAERVVIDSATHELLRYRTIEFDADPKEGVNLYVGLADMDGRQILPPDFMKLEIINRNWAYGKVQMQGDFLIDIRTGARSPMPYGVNAFDFNGARLVLLGNNARGQGYKARSDLHRLGHDGQIAASFPGMLQWYRFGPYLVLNLADEATIDQSPRPPAMALWLDQSGQIVNTSPEMSLLHYGGAVKAMIVSDAKPPLRGLALSQNQPFTYKLYDEHGAPMVMPNGVTEFALIQDPFKLDQMNQARDGWLLVREKDGVRDVRVTRGADPKQAMEKFDTLMRVDDVAIVSESIQHGLNPGLRPMLVMREPGKGWALYPSLGGTIGHNRFAQAQDAANLFSVDMNALLAKQSAERRAKEEAAAAAEASRRAAGVESFENVMSRKDAISPAQFRSALQVASFQAGGTYLSRFLAMYPDAAATPGVRESACRDSAIACDIATRNQNAIQDAYNEKQRRLFEQRVALIAKWNGMNNPNPDVRVNIYENGQFRSEVMPKSHYENLYK